MEMQNLDNQEGSESGVLVCKSLELVEVESAMFSRIESKTGWNYERAQKGKSRTFLIVRLMQFQLSNEWPILGHYSVDARMGHCGPG